MGSFRRLSDVFRVRGNRIYMFRGPCSLRDSLEAVMMAADESVNDPLTKYFSPFVYVCALGEGPIFNQISPEAIDICETAYMDQSRKFNPDRISQRKNAAAFSAEMKFCATRPMK